MAGRIAYLGNIVTQGLVLDLDAAIQGSYPKTGTLWTDISGNNNNGTLTNGPAYTGSDYGAIVFDGTNDYVDMSLSIAQGQGNQTYSHWIKTTSGVSSDKVISFEATANASNYTRIGSVLTSGSYFQFGGRGVSNEPTGNGYFKRSSSPIVPNLWTNVVGMWDVTNSTIRLYINGSETDGSFIGAGSVETHANTAPDAVRIGSSKNAEYFPGSISNVQIYNQALSQFQVWQNFNAYKSRYGIPDIVTDGLVLNLDAGNPYSYLSGSSGTTWTNVAPASSSLSGSLINGTTYSNGAMVFDGTNDYVSLGTFNGFGSTNRTISVWFKTTITPPGPTRVITFPADDSGNDIPAYTLAITANGTIGVGVGGIPYNGYVDNIPYTIGSWVNITTTITSNTLTYYKNSIIGTSVTNTGTVTTNPIGYIGRYNGNYGQYLTGSVANVQVYNRALTQAEITQNFNALRGRYGI